MRPAGLSFPVQMNKNMSTWLRRGDGIWSDPRGEMPNEVVLLRVIGLFFLVLVIVDTATTHPLPSWHGKGLVVTVALVAIIAGVVAANPRNRMSDRRRIAGLALLVAIGTLLEVIQPNGVWEAVPYFVAIVAAMRLPRPTSVIVLLAGLTPFIVVSGVQNDWGPAIAVISGAVPWFIVLSLMRGLREQHSELKASRAAEARAAADAERGRLAREMHDVLAHSLSALALQLETTRLLAREHGADTAVTHAIDQAHHLAVGGLDEARRAIGAARGDELPGPERLEALADAFSEQSGLPVEVEILGEPRELAPDARLAIYRTAQEALTNIRRHAAAARVRVRLHYDRDATVLTVEDQGAAALPVAVGPPGATGGYGLTGMRERAELLRGSLLAEPTDDGFRVQLWLPAS